MNFLLQFSPLIKCVFCLAEVSFLSSLGLASELTEKNFWKKEIANQESEKQVAGRFNG